MTQEFAKLRHEMVEHQIEARGVGDPKVLAAFRAVERHRFVPETSRDFAYDDAPLSIGGGQTISQPYMVALMTLCLDLIGNERVLEVGTGSGYQAAILAQLGCEVHTIERDPALAERAARLLAELGYARVTVHTGDGTLGIPDFAPYQGILVTAGGPKVPETLKAQLDPGGGVLAIPVGGRHMQELTRVLRQGDLYTQETLCGCRFVPLVGEQGW